MDLLDGYDVIDGEDMFGPTYGSNIDSEGVEIDVEDVDAGAVYELMGEDMATLAQIAAENADEEIDWIVGADVLGADPGYDINAINKLVRGAKPLAKAQGLKFLDQAMKALAVAQLSDTGHPSANVRREILMGQLRHMKETLEASPLEVIPEDKFPEKSAAEILRVAVLKAIAEFNSVAQMNADLASARMQIFSDIAENAKQLYQEAKKKVEDVAWYLRWGTTGLVVGVTVGVVLIGYGGYKLLASQGASNVLGTYLAVRRR